MRKKLILLALLAFCISCGKKGINIEKEKESLKNADIAFSNLSKQKGMKAAFIQYMDSAAVILRPGRSPMRGMLAGQYIYNSVDTSYILTWVPRAVEISATGDLGYTYGVWTSYQKKWLSDSLSQGTYVTIWKKQSDGNWKFVLDSGNPGIDKQK